MITDEAGAVGPAAEADGIYTDPATLYGGKSIN